MTRNEPISNMGASTRSVTKAVMEAMAAEGDISMIGQFGVNYYAYPVSYEVCVVSQHRWCHCGSFATGVCGPPPARCCATPRDGAELHLDWDSQGRA